MSKKLFIFIILIIIAAGGVSLWFFVIKDQSVSDTPTDSFLENLFPSGTGSDDGSFTQPSANNNATGTEPENPLAIKRLRQVHTTPVANITLLKGVSNSVIRFVERATGHIYEGYSDTGEVRRLSNTTIPKVYEAFFGGTGNEVLLRYLRDDNNTIRTFYARLASTSEEVALEGIFLDDNIRNITYFGGKIFYFTKNQAGGRGIVARLDGTGKAAVFESGIGGFIPSWTSQDVILLYTAPGADILGTFFTLSPISGEYRKVVDGVVGGTGILNLGGNQLFLGLGGKTITSSVVNTSTKEKRPLSVSTIADKCVWSTIDPLTIYCAVPKTIPLGQYPDSWYQGLVSFEDRVWKINTETGETEMIFDPKIDAGKEMDIVSIILDPEEKVLGFIDKKDLTPWVYQIEI